MLVIVGLVLAIACSNLATLLLVRGASRAKEISIRLAIGAARRQLVRQLLTESVLLSVAGGIAGCVLAWWAIQWLRTIELPFAIDLTLDVRVLAFAVGISVVTGIACGLAPALTATKVDLLPVLRGEDGTQGIAPRRLTLKHALIVFQVSMSVLLLGATSIFLQWADAERANPLGYAVDGVAMLETDSRFTGYSVTHAQNHVRRASAPDRRDSRRGLRCAHARPTDGDDGPADRRGGDDGRPGNESPRRQVLGRAWVPRDAAYPPPAWPSVRHSRPCEHAARRRDQRDDGSRLPRHSKRGRSPVPAGGGPGLLDGGHWRRARHRHQPARSGAARVLSLVHAIRRPADHDRRAHVAGCSGSVGRDAPRTAQYRRDTPRDHGEDDGPASRRRADGIERDHGVSGGPRDARPAAGQRRPLRRDRVCRHPAIARDWHPPGARRTQPAGGLERGAGRRGARRHRHGPRTGIVGAGDAGASRRLRAGAGGVVVSAAIDPVALLAIAIIMGLVGVAAALVPARRAASTNPLVALRHD